jgi:hypothetical protein
VSAYLRIRKWVDESLGAYSVVSYKVPFFLAIIPFFAVPLLGSWWLAPSIAWAALWTGFVSWRAYRLMRATGIKGDRAYDRKGKFRLSHEYWSTESATASGRRKK